MNVVTRLLRDAAASVTEEENNQAAEMANGGMTLNEILQELRDAQGRRGYGRLDQKLTVVWGCVTLLTHRLQSLPVNIVGAQGQIVGTLWPDGRTTGSVPVWMRSRGEWDWDDMLGASCWSFLMRGNCFLRPTRAPNGVITFAGIVHPDVVSADASSQRFKEGERELAQLLVNGRPAQLIQGRWASEPGNWKGLSPIGATRKSAYIGEAADDAIARHFQQGVRKQGALTTDQKLGRRNKTETLAQMRAKWSGVDNWWSPIVLDQGLSWTDFSMTASDAEFVALSEWNDARIAGQIFHVDPTLLGIKQGGSTITYRNAIDREVQLWRDGLRPLAVKVQRIFSELLPPGQSIDFDERGLVTGSPADRVKQAYQLAQINKSQNAWVFGWDEIRDRAGFPPLEGPAPAPLMVGRANPLEALMDDLQEMIIDGEFLIENEASGIETRQLTNGH